MAQHTEHLPAPIEPDQTGVLSRRKPNRNTGRITFWYAPLTGDLILPDGKRRTIPTTTTLEALLDAIKRIATEQYGKTKADLRLIAGTLIHNRPKQQWFEDVHKWHSRLFWKYLTGEYQCDVFTVYMSSSGGYFGEEVKDLEGIYEAWLKLNRLLGIAFKDDGCNLMAGTPAATGRELLLASLPDDREYTRLTTDLRELLHHNSYQGRVETLQPKRDILENGVYILDGKFFYASCLSGLPVGPAYNDEVNEFLGVIRKDGRLAPICPAFYHATVTVPKNWHHIGLMKMYTPLEGESIYPNDPGYSYSNWTQASEVALMLDNPLGIPWHVHIDERIYWPSTDDVTPPLAQFRAKLIKLWEEPTNEFIIDTIPNFV